MSTEQERFLRDWLAARDPGDAPARLRAAIARVPYETRRATFPTFDIPTIRLFGVSALLRPLVILVALLAIVLAAVGAAVFRPWVPFPPRGLIAYTVPLDQAGASGIRLMAADGSAQRQVTAGAPNIRDHSPRWSADGRTLLFARTTDLDPLSACGGVGSIVLYDMTSGTERVVATGLRPINVVGWSPTEDRVAYTYPPPGCGGAGVELGVVDLRSGQVTTEEVVPPVSELSPAQNVQWHVEWAGDVAVAVADATTTTSNGLDFTTTVEVPSHDRRSSIRYAWTTPDRNPALTAIDVSTGATIDLGPGGMPTWAPDDSAIAFIRPGGPAGPSAVDYVRDELVIVAAGTWRSRSLVDVLVIDGPPADWIPAVSWTSDGGAIYWLDRGGSARVVDVVTGRSAEISALSEGCDDLQWQPLR